MDTPTLAREIAEIHFARRPELRERYGERGFQRCVQDAAYHLQYLEQSLRLDNEQLFADYVRWAKIMLETRGVPVDDLIANLGIVAEVVSSEVPAARSTIEAAVRSLSAPVQDEAANPHAELAGAYLQAVLAGQRNVAGISVTISYHLAAAEQVIREIRRDARCSRTKIIVGGYPFRIAPELWKTIGADGYAADAQEAIELADRLTAP
jgi:hypothetical protein